MPSAIQNPPRWRLTRQAPQATERSAAVQERPARRPRRLNVAAAAVAGTVGAGIVRLARLVRIAAGLAVILIAAAVLLRLLDANGSNSIVGDIHDAGGWLAGPFKGLFTFTHPKAEMALNWGIAAGVYLIGGYAIARAITRFGRRAGAPAR
jgi:hypothetical protein